MDLMGLSYDIQKVIYCFVYVKKMIYRLLENPALELTVNPDASMEHLISSDQTSVSALPLQLISQIARY